MGFVQQRRARLPEIGQWANQAGGIHRILEYLGEPTHPRTSPPPPEVRPTGGRLRYTRNGALEALVKDLETQAVTEPDPEERGQLGLDRELRAVPAPPPAAREHAIVVRQLRGPGQVDRPASRRPRSSS
jgi:hypothetical protein